MIDYSRGDSAITSNVTRRLVGDHNITGWKSAGLLMPSVATGVLRTITQTMIERRLGTMSGSDMQAIDRSLREALGL